MSRGKTWTKEETKILVKNLDRPTDELVDIFEDRPERTIQNKLYDLKREKKLFESFKILRQTYSLFEVKNIIKIDDKTANEYEKLDAFEDKYIDDHDEKENEPIHDTDVDVIAEKVSEIVSNKIDELIQRIEVKNTYIEKAKKYDLIVNQAFGNATIYMGNTDYLHMSGKLLEASLRSMEGMRYYDKLQELRNKDRGEMKV